MNEKLQSSTGSGKLSRTVKGILTSLIPVFILIGQAVGIEVTQQGLAEGIAIITGLAGAITALMGYIRAKEYAKGAHSS